MANAYFKDNTGVWAGSNAQGALVQFEYSGKIVQVSVPDGRDPLEVANAYIENLKSPKSMWTTDEWGDYQPRVPDYSPDANPPSGDSSPDDMIELDKIVTTPDNDGQYSGNTPSNFGSTWTPDGINIIEGYQPYSSIPVLSVLSPASAAISVPMLETPLHKFMDGSNENAIPVLRIR